MMKNILWMLPILLILQTNALLGSTTPSHNKKNNAVWTTVPSYEILKEQYGIKLKWHQRIKYSILKFAAIITGGSIILFGLIFMIIFVNTLLAFY